MPKMVYNLTSKHIWGCFEIYEMSPKIDLEMTTFGGQISTLDFGHLGPDPPCEIHISTANSFGQGYGVLVAQLWHDETHVRCLLFLKEAPRAQNMESGGRIIIAVVLSRRFQSLHLFGLNMPILVYTTFWEDLMKVDFRSKMAIFEGSGIPKCRF